MEFLNYMMVNALTLNPKDVNIVKDFSTLFAVSMELLMTICVIYNAPKSISFARVLVLLSRETANVTKDMFLSVVLTIRLIETNV